VADSSVSDAEVVFLEELGRRKIKFMVVGMSAAVIQGADLGTEDIDLWFSSLADPGLDEAARAAGGHVDFGGVSGVTRGRRGRGRAGPEEKSPPPAAGAAPNEPASGT